MKFLHLKAILTTINIHKMPYGSKRKYRRKRYRKSNSLVKKVNKLSRMLKPEFKMTEGLTFNAAAVPDTGSVALLTGVAIGDDQFNRDGNQIQAKSLLLRGRFLADVDAGLGSTVRFMIVRDKQQVGDTTPAIGDILDATGGNMISPLNNETVGRFQVLMDRYIYLDQLAPAEKYFKKYIKLNHPIRFNGTTATDTQKNHIYAVICSSESTATHQPLCDLMTRFRYTDM